MNRLSLDYWKSQLLADEYWMQCMQMIHKGKDIEGIIGFAFADLMSQPERMAKADINDFKRLVNSWLSNKRPDNGKRKGIDPQAALRNIYDQG